MQTRLDLLSKATWDYHDIAEYFGCKKSKANLLKARIIKEFNGSVPYGSNLVKVDSALELLGTTREKEIEYLSKIKEAVNEKL